MKATVAITGATGFIGRWLARKLTHEGYHLKCLGRKESDVTYLKSLGTELVAGDVMEKEALERLIQQVEVIYHLAGLVSVSRAIANPLTTFLINTVGTLNLLETLRSDNRSDCLFIYLSSDRVYGNPSSSVVRESDPSVPLEPYAASKLSAEHLIQAYARAYSIPFVILRGANVYGPGQRPELFIPSVIQRVMSGEEHIRVGNLDTYRNFVYVEDLVEALYLSLLWQDQTKNEIFNISERTTKIGKVIDILLDLCQRHLGKMFQVVQDPSLLRPSEVESRKFELDCTKAHKVLGWSPKFSLEKGLEETFNFFYQEKVGTKL